VERWVAQQLSSALGVGERADGVSANVVFPGPRRLVDEVVAAASGFDADGDPASSGAGCSSQRRASVSLT